MLNFIQANSSLCISSSSLQFICPSCNHRQGMVNKTAKPQDFHSSSQSAANVLLKKADDFNYSIEGVDLKEHIVDEIFHALHPRNKDQLETLIIAYMQRYSTLPKLYKEEFQCQIDKLKQELANVTDSATTHAAKGLSELQAENKTSKESLAQLYQKYLQTLDKFEKKFESILKTLISFLDRKEPKNSVKSKKNN